MPAASKNKLPPTLFVTAEINIKWEVVVHGITDPFQGFYTLFPVYCWWTTNCLFEQLALIDILVGCMGAKHKSKGLNGQGI